MATQPQTWISKAEAAERLGCSEKTIDRLRHKGELGAVKSSHQKQGHVKITLASLEAFEQRQLEADQPGPAWDDIERRFPIPELDQARAASAARRAEAKEEQ
jgi:excisionase family DNA binding protein